MIGAEPDMVFVGGAQNAEDGIRIFREQSPNVSLIDLRMPGMSGIDAIVHIKRGDPLARIIALTTYKGDHDVHRALASGACSYLLKDVIHNELIEAVRKVHAGQRYIAAAAASELAEHTPRIELTRRELDVLRLLPMGNRNKQIAGILGLSEDTVKFHVKSILAKLGVGDRTHAVSVAIQRGILHID